MKTRLPLFLSAITILAVSCNDKDLPTPINVETKIQEQSSSAIITEELKSPGVLALGESFKVDEKNRVIEFKTQDHTHKFSYNSIGKLIKVESFDVNNSTLDATITYTNLGNNQRIFDGARLFKIDSEGSITSVSIPSLAIEYTLSYDANGNINTVRAYKNGSLTSRVKYQTTNLTAFSTLISKSPFLFIYKFL